MALASCAVPGLEMRAGRMTVGELPFDALELAFGLRHARRLLMQALQKLGHMFTLRNRRPPTLGVDQACARCFEMADALLVAIRALADSGLNG